MQIPDWLWQGIVSNIVWVVSAALVVALLAYLRQQWAAPVFYGLAAGAAVALILVALNAVAFFRTQSPLDVGNIDRILRDWIGDFGFTNTEIKDQSAHVTFALEIPSFASTSLIRRILVSRRKATERYLELSVVYKLTGDADRAFSTMTPQQIAQLSSEIRIELARANLLWKVRTMPLQVEAFYYLPITSRLTSADFVKAIYRVQSIMHVVVELTTNRVRQFVPSPQVTP